MRIVLCCMVLLFMIGCSDEKSPKHTQTYTYDSLQDSYTISLKDDGLHITTNTNTINKVLLLMLLDSDEQSYSIYYEHLNHLLATHNNLEIFGILKNAMSKEQLESFIATNNITFPIIVPHNESSSALFTELAHIRTTKNIASNPQKDSLQDSKESQESTDNLVRPYSYYPYFLLYDKDGKFIQYYEGIVVEEIFSSDIARISQ